MLGVAEVSERGGQVRGSDERDVDTRHRHDVVDRLHGLRGLDLDDHENLGVGAGPVVGGEAPEPGGAVGARHATRPLRRVLAGAHGRLALAAVSDQRDHHALGPEVEHALDHGGVVPLHPHDRRGATRRQRLELDEQRLVVPGPVLHVDEQPVEPGVAHDLGRDRTAEVEPPADRLPAGLEIALDAIVDELGHSGPPTRPRESTVSSAGNVSRITSPTIPRLLGEICSSVSPAVCQGGYSMSITSTAGTRARRNGT